MKYNINNIITSNRIDSKVNLVTKYSFILNFERKYKYSSYFFSRFKGKSFEKIVFYKYSKIFKMMLFIYCGFVYSKIFLKIGLGFRKKYNRTFNCVFLNIVKRKIVLFKPSFNSFFFIYRKKNLYVFSGNKRKLFYYIIRFKNLRKETIYKYKGIFTALRVKIFKKMTRSLLFARRVKIKKIKLKLTKKQKLKR